jgi:hypothetical protein
VADTSCCRLLCFMVSVLVLVHCSSRMSPLLDASVVSVRAVASRHHAARGRQPPLARRQCPPETTDRARASPQTARAGHHDRAGRSEGCPLESEEPVTLGFAHPIVDPAGHQIPARRTSPPRRRAMASTTSAPDRSGAVGVGLHKRKPWVVPPLRAVDARDSVCREIRERTQVVFSHPHGSQGQRQQCRTRAARRIAATPHPGVCKRREQECAATSKPCVSGCHARGAVEGGTGRAGFPRVEPVATTTDRGAGSCAP